MTALMVAQQDQETVVEVAVESVCMTVFETQLNCERKQSSKAGKQQSSKAGKRKGAEGWFINAM